MQEEVIVEILLDSGVTELVMSSEFAKKQRFKLKKLEKSEEIEKRKPKKTNCTKDQRKERKQISYY